MPSRSLILILLLALLPWTSLHAAPPYGRTALGGLKQYGVAVRVACTAELQQHQETFKAHIEKRLQSRGIQVVPAGSVTLKLLMTSIRSDDGFFVVHMNLELNQSTWLPSANRMIDAPTWDSWKMGEYREDGLLSEVDDLTRQFLNDYIASN